MESNQPFKLSIPKREYNVLSPPDNTLNKVMPVKVNPQVEEKKKGFSVKSEMPISKNLDVRDLNIPLLRPTETAQLSDDPIINRNKIKEIKKKFKEFRKILKKKRKDKVGKLTKEFELQRKEILAESDYEIGELNKLQEFMLNQLNQEIKTPILNPEPVKNTQVDPEIIPVKANILNTTAVEKNPKFNIPQQEVNTENYINLNMKYVLNVPSLSISNKKGLKNFLFNEINSNLCICKNFNQAEYLKFPDQFNEGSNFLLFSENELLVVGSNCPAYILNIPCKSMKKLQNLNINRAYFALSFIRGRVAVIGGISESGEYLKSVEVLNIVKDKSNWILFNEMNEARSHCQSIVHMNFTYVFGGMSGAYIKTIEKCQKKIWQLLNIELPSLFINFPMCAKGQKIYIFGGADLYRSLSDVYSLNMETLEFEKEKNLSNYFSAYSNACVRLFGGIFYLFDPSNSKIIKYSPG